MVATKKTLETPAQEPRTATTAVLKASGSVLSDPDFLEALGRRARQLRDEGHAVILVHGGGDQISDLHERLGVPFVKRRGLRATSDEGMRLTAMVLRGLTNATLVASLVSQGLEAIGLSGVDLGLMRSSFLNREELGRVGGPPRVAKAKLLRLLDGGFTPVLAPVCLGPDGGLLNVNADTVAHMVAESLGSACLEFVSNVPGVLADGRVLGRLSVAETQALLSSSQVGGGMIPKLQAALAAVRSGVRRVRIGDLESLAAGTATEVTEG